MAKKKTSAVDRVAKFLSSNEARKRPVPVASYPKDVLEDVEVLYYQHGHTYESIARFLRNIGYDATAKRVAYYFYNRVAKT